MDIGLLVAVLACFQNDPAAVRERTFRGGRRPPDARRPRRHRRRVADARQDRGFAAGGRLRRRSVREALRTLALNKWFEVEPTVGEMRIRPGQRWRKRNETTSHSDVLPAASARGCRRRWKVPVSLGSVADLGDEVAYCGVIDETPATVVAVLLLLHVADLLTIPLLLARRDQLDRPLGRFGRSRGRCGRHSASRRLRIRSSGHPLVGEPAARAHDR